MRGGDDGGAGSVLAVAIVAAMLAVTALALPLYLVLAAKQAMGGAADASALAAADVRVGLVPGEPCVIAASVASANGAELGACEFDGLVVTVTVRTHVAGFAVEASATAGPAANRRAPPLQEAREWGWNRWDTASPVYGVADGPRCRPRPTPL